MEQLFSQFIDSTACMCILIIVVFFCTFCGDLWLCAVVHERRIFRTGDSRRCVWISDDCVLLLYHILLCFPCTSFRSVSDFTHLTCIHKKKCSIKNKLQHATDWSWGNWFHYAAFTLCFFFLLFVYFAASFNFIHILEIKSKNSTTTNWIIKENYNLQLIHRAIVSSVSNYVSRLNFDIFPIQLCACSLRIVFLCVCFWIWYKILDES